MLFNGFVKKIKRQICGRNDSSAGGLKRYAVKKKLTRLLAAGVSFGMLLKPLTAYAVGSWIAPGFDTTAEGAIVIEADTGTVLWGKNINEQFCPASITKLMTGLIVLERCSMDEKVTVAAEAVNNLESGASAVGLAAGDVLTVEELLNAMLLRSANDAANALAVYVSGSIDAFAEEMTSKARELGCKNTIFRNPSGLTKPENITTAYDMALIGAECSRTPGFLEIESRLSYKVESGDSRHPDGFTVHQEHKMLLKGTPYSDKRAIGGKTGFIKASGNTLVTIAEENGVRLAAVVLKDKNPDHYKDTEKLLNFGFDNFENRVIEKPVESFDVENRLKADKIISEDGKHNIKAAAEAVITLPKGAVQDSISISYDYNLSSTAPADAVARLVFKYADINVGSVYILNEYESDLMVETNDDGADRKLTGIPVKLILIGALMLLIAAGAVFAVANTAKKSRRESERRAERLLRRRRRLKELNMSEEEFLELVKNKNRSDTD